MDKDLQANLVSASALGAYLMNIETILTVLVLATALIFNIYRIYQMHRKIKDNE